MPTAERERALWWRAVSALRQAETLADLGAVAGPADAPPEKGSESGFIADWKKRATEALKKAHEWLVEKPSAAVRERARQVATRVQQGASAIRAASPQQAAKSGLDALADFAKQMLWTTGLSGGAALAIAVIVLWLYFKK